MFGSIRSEKSPLLKNERAGCSKEKRIVLEKEVYKMHHSAIVTSGRRNRRLSTRRLGNWILDELVSADRLLAMDEPQFRWRDDLVRARRGEQPKNSNEPEQPLSSAEIYAAIRTIWDKSQGGSPTSKTGKIVQSATKLVQRADYREETVREQLASALAAVQKLRDKTESAERCEKRKGLYLNPTRRHKGDVICDTLICVVEGRKHICGKRFVSKETLATHRHSESSQGGSLCI